MTIKPADTGMNNNAPAYYRINASLPAVPVVTTVPAKAPPDDLIKVRFEGRVLEFAQIETGAKQKEGVQSKDVWNGYSRFALFTRPESNDQLRRVLEILTRQGWGGRIVTDIAITGFPEWKVRFNINPDELTYDRAVYAVVEVSYRAWGKTFKGKVDTSGDVWEVVADE